MDKKLIIDSIVDWQVFEDLVAAYFNNLKYENSIYKNIVVDKSGNGPDGGKDIIVDIEMDDGFVCFKRKWVIQCKCFNRTVNTSAMTSVNIPTLVHSQGANGYLLICKKRVSSNLMNMFNSLRRSCKFKYHYEVWDGPTFTQKLSHGNNMKIYKQFFPDYYEYIRQGLSK
jgi:hypothetical protein